MEFLSLNDDILVIHSTSKYIKNHENVRNKQYFAVSGDELLKVEDSSQIDKYILEPSPRKVNIKVQNLEKFYELDNIDYIDKYFDSPLAISLQIAKEINSSSIFIIGFDGYGELKNKKELYLMHENQEIIDSFSSYSQLISLTPTKYKNIREQSIYGMISV